MIFIALPQLGHKSGSTSKISWISCAQLALALAFPLIFSLMQARYGVENCDRMDLNRVQNAWKKLRRELRNNRKRPEA